MGAWQENCIIAHAALLFTLRLLELIFQLSHTLLFIGQRLLHFRMFPRLSGSADTCCVNDTLVIFIRQLRQPTFILPQRCLSFSKSVQNIVNSLLQVNVPGLQRSLLQPCDFRRQTIDDAANSFPKVPSHSSFNIAPHVRKSASSTSSVDAEGLWIGLNRQFTAHSSTFILHKIKKKMNNNIAVRCELSCSSIY
jgi:hypothetical protein